MTGFLFVATASEPSETCRMTVLPGRLGAAGAGSCARTSPAGAALAVSIRSTLNLASVRAASLKLLPITSGTNPFCCAEVELLEALDLDCLDDLGRGAATASLQAPRFRTYSRTSAETEAHRKGCAMAAVAPSSNAELTSHGIPPRFMAPRRFVETRWSRRPCSTNGQDLSADAA